MMTPNKKSVFSMLLATSFLAQAILAASSFLFARLYSPEAFGTLAYITGVTAITTTVVGLRFDHMAFSRPSEEKRQMYAAAFWVFSMLSMFAGVVCIVLLLVWPHQNSELGWIIAFAVINGMYYLCGQWQIANAAYASFARIRVVQALLQLGSGAALLSVADNRGMILAVMLSQGATAATIWFSKESHEIKVFGKQTFAYVRSQIKPAALNSFSALLQYSTPLAPLVVGAIFFSKQEIGAYFLFTTALAAPCAIIRRSILSYFNGEIKSSKQIRHALVQAASGRARLIAVGAAVLVALMFGLHYYAVPLTRILFGHGWESYAALLLPLVAFYAFDTMLQPFSTFLGMWGRESMQIAIEISRFFLVYVLWPLLICLYGPDFIVAVEIYLAFMLAVYIANCIVVLRVTPKWYGLASS